MASDDFSALINNAKPLDITDYLTRGWRLLWRNPGYPIAYAALTLLGSFILLAIPLVGSVAVAVLWGPAFAGFYIAYLMQLNDKTVVFEDFLRGFRRFLPLMLVGLFTSLLTSFGMFLLLIPGIYLLVSYLFALPLAINRRMDFWPAMELSRQYITNNWLAYFRLAGVLFLCNVAGFLLFGIGLLISVPFTIAVITCAYQDQLAVAYTPGDDATVEHFNDGL